MDEVKKDLLKKWQLTCALRGIVVFDDGDDDYEVLEVLEQLQAFEDARNERNVHHQCGEDLFKLGLNYHDYQEYSNLLEEEAEAIRDAELQAIIDSNELVNEIRSFNCKKVDGPGKCQSYYEMDVPTDLHGVIKVKARIVNVTWSHIRVWRDYVLPDKTKVHACEHSSWHQQHATMNNKWPQHWRSGSASGIGRDNLAVTMMWNIANNIKLKYKSKGKKK